MPAALFVLHLVAVHLLSQASAADPPRPGAPSAATPEAKRARADHPVRLVAALEGIEDGRSVVFADVPRVDFGDGAGVRAAIPFPAGEPLVVRWWKVEPAQTTADNEKGGFHWDPIAYRETEWLAENARTLSRDADVHTTILPDRGGLGTMAFKVEVRAAGTTLASPGRESTFRGGLSADVARVSYRRDDTFLGYLTELYNTPYIWASAGRGAEHQAERQIGADCADFICYGLRRAGGTMEYGFTGDVPRWGGGTPLFSIARAGADGRFLDARGHAIPVGGAKGMRPGDLLLFRGHVGAFARDRAPIGVLDVGDEIVHTAWAPPTEESFSSAAIWTPPPFTVWRVRGISQPIAK